MARGADGGSISPAAPDVVEDILLCRVDVLCLRKIEPDRMGRAPDGALLNVVTRPSFTDVSIASWESFPPIEPRSPPDIENWLDRSFEEPFMLLCRSSKLGDGRKSREPVVLSLLKSCPPNEKREWLFLDEAFNVVPFSAVTRVLALGW